MRSVFWGSIPLHYLNFLQLSNLVLLNGIVEFIDDLDLRLHHRSQMESAGLQRVLELCLNFGVPNIDKQVKILQGVLAEDEKKLRERLDQEMLRDLNNPQDVYNAIFAKTQGSRAGQYFLSMMQHLLLIREEGQPLVYYYQLLDSLVTDVVLDKKLGGAEHRLGHSVDRIIAQFNEVERYQAAEDAAAEARALAVRLKLEKEVLEDEVAQGQEGLVGALKTQLAHLEAKLTVSRETTSRLQSQLHTQKIEYEDRISQLETQILELFRMLKEFGNGVVLDGNMDRKALFETLEKKFQRQDTINILEGRRRKKLEGSSAVEGVEGEDTIEDTEATPGKSSLRRHAAASGSTTRKNSNPLHTFSQHSSEVRRMSQFMDADEADAHEQIQQQLAAGVKLVSGFCLLFQRLTHDPYSVLASVRWSF